MNSQQGLIPPGSLTQLCEGNNNPYSAHWSRRLRIGPKGHMIIGKGYNLTTHGEKQGFLDLSEAGVPKPKAQILAKAANLSNFEATKFIAFYKTEIVLTKEQEHKLFEIKHKRAEAILRAKLDIYLKKTGYISTYNIVPYQWEVLSDIIYRGDLSLNNERHLFIALNTALKERDSKIFDRTILDVNYWRQFEVPEDRIKMRCIFINEWNSFTDPANLPAQDQADDEGVTPMLLKFPDLFSIEGFFVDLKRDSLNFVLKRSFIHPNAKHAQMISGVALEELIIAMKLCYDKTIDATIIGGTLKPIAVNNMEDKRMKKEFYPDYYHTKQIIAGTKFSEIVSEAAKIVTQMATGSAIVEKGGFFEKEGEFEHLQAFREIGIMPIENMNVKSEIKQASSQKMMRPISPNLKHSGSFFQMLQPLKTINLQSADQESKLIRLWLVVKNVKETHVSNDEGEYFGISEVRLGLKACRITITPQGAWEETAIEDPHDPAYLFAHKFTDKYNLISKLFPAFKKVEQMHKAILLADWMRKKAIPVDMSMIDNYYQKGLQYISSPTKTIFKEQGVSSPEIRQNTGTLANLSLSPTKKRPSTRSHTFHFTKGSLAHMNSSVEYSPVRNSKSPDHNRGLSFSSMATVKLNSYAIFGGVLLDIEQGHSSQKNVTSNGIFDSQPKQTEEHFDILFQGKFQIDYPFQNTICKVCENYLKYSEIMSSSKGVTYCRLHHPFSCDHCYNVIKSDCLDVEGKKYHSTCIICKHCERIIHGKLLKIEQGFLHVQCSEEFMRETTSAQKRTVHSSLSPSRGRGNPKKSIVSFKL